MTFFRHPLGHFQRLFPRRPFVVKQALNFTAQALFVELECFLALPAEM
jgi:hypothetical protein